MEMLSEGLYFLIRSFAGSSMTSDVLTQIHIMHMLRELDETVEIAGMEFAVSKRCTCHQACGGIFCVGVKVYKLKGNANVQRSGDRT